MSRPFTRRCADAQAAIDGTLAWLREHPQAPLDEVMDRVRREHPRLAGWEARPVAGAALELSRRDRAGRAPEFPQPAYPCRR